MGIVCIKDSSLTENRIAVTGPMNPALLRSAWTTWECRLLIECAMATEIALTNQMRLLAFAHAPRLASIAQSKFWLSIFCQWPELFQFLCNFFVLLFFIIISVALEWFLNVINWNENYREVKKNYKNDKIAIKNLLFVVYIWFIFHLCL